MATIAEALSLALQHHQAGRLQDAEALYRQILQAEPNQPDALHLLGLIAHQVGRPEVAIDLISKAIAINPAVAALHNHIALAYQAQGRLEEALDHLRQAITLKPAFAEAYYNLGLILQKQGKLEEAEAQYQSALVFQPTFADAWNNLGNVLRTQGKLEEAVAKYRQALLVESTHTEASYNLGNVLQAQSKLEEAAAHYRQVLTFKPTHVEALYSLGLVLQEQGKLEEAVSQYERVLSLKPDFAGAENQLMHQLQRLCDWKYLEKHIEHHKEVLRSPSSSIIGPFSVLCIPSSAAEQLACAKRFVSSYLSWVVPLREKLGFHFARVNKPRLRIAYLSADFYQHATAYLLAELFELHDRNLFEVFAYSYGPDDGGRFRKRIAHACDVFVDISSVSFRDVACRIYGDGIDILIDLKGYTKGARSEIVALRPAPIQVNYLGYPGTMGADFIDYIITDRFISPPEQAPYFSEKFVYMPECYQINDRKRALDQNAPTRTEYGLPQGGFVFCCFSNTYKIMPEVFDVWMRLLQKIPGSVIWLLEMNSRVAANLRREASVRMVDPERLVFTTGIPIDKHLSRLRLADLALDTLPVNGHTTASDALWSGLPVLTCVGDTFVSRVAGSLLTAIGLPELITRSLAEYETAALRLAKNPRELAGLRERLAKNRLSTPLFDSKRYTRYLEKAYRMMWEIYAKGEAPRKIEVPELETPPSKGLSR